ncbi:MAG: CAP domain-containing protein [Actinomycetota bacterium]
MIVPLRRAVCLLVLTLLAAVAAVSAVGAQDATWTLAPQDEARFVDHINAERAAAGLGPLTLDTSMRDAARSWTYWMAENVTLAHADDIVTGAPSDWTKVGENVGRGGSLDAVMDAFMASPSHAANVLDPGYTLVGIGVVWTDDGRLYTTHRFASVSGGAPAPPPPEPRATGEPTPEVVATPEPPTEAPATLPFEDAEDAPIADTEPAARPTAEPDRLAATMTLLLSAG